MLYFIIFLYLKIMSIKLWPVAYRPREKLLLQGPASLSDAELLALFIQTGCKGETALSQGYQLLNKFGNLKGILDQPLASFEGIRGIGKAKFVLMQAALELAQRYLEQGIATNSKALLASSAAVKRFLRLYFRQLTQEVVVSMFLTQQYQLIAVETLFHGSINHAPIFPRQIVTRALYHKAPAIILAHNHPSGDSMPSQSDIDITHQLKSQLGFLEITLLDHCIVTERTVYSLAEHGWA